MSLRGKSLVARILLFLVVSSFYVLNGYSAVTISGTYYNGAGELSEFISVENAGFAGRVEILPADFVDISVSSKGSGHVNSNGGSAPIKATSILQMESHGQTATVESNLEARSAIKKVASVEWGHKVAIGRQGSAMNLYTDIVTHPGMLTFPTTKTCGVITTGMKLDAQYLENGQPLFVTRYVPPEEFSDFPLSLGIVDVGDDSVHMEIELSMSTKLE